MSQGRKGLLPPLSYTAVSALAFIMAADLDFLFLPMALHRLATISQQALQDSSAIARLQLLVGACRPRRGASDEQIAAQFDSLLKLLEREPFIAARMREALAEVLQGTRQTSLYAESGSLPERGFSSELMRRIHHSILPDLSDHEDLAGIVAELFNSRDGQWLVRVPEATWLALAQQLSAAPQDGPVPVPQHIPHVLHELLDSIQLLSLRIAARGLDPEMAQLDPTLLENESAFSAQQIECLRWLERYKNAYLPTASAATSAAASGHAEACDPVEDLEGDFKHLCVLWQQCQDLVEKLHRRASRLGTSMQLSQTLATLRQKLARIAALADMAMLELRNLKQGQGFSPKPEHIALFQAVLVGEIGRNSLRALLRDTGSTLALRVTDNAARSGEHYITDSRSEYYALFRSAFGSGLIIALMTLQKIFIMDAHLPALTEALLVCLNYGLGFVLIHMLGGTVATKQPAMTAAAIASTLGQSSDKNMASTALLIARTSRSQLASVLGNVGLAIPCGAAISVLLLYFTGKLPVDADASVAMLSAAHPWQSAALIFAATAGFCLFLSGLVSGYYDNLNAYNRIPDRIRQLGRRHPRIPAGLVARLADYIDGHLGALMGNFLFGFMLGGVSSLGHMTGLPLDIRHVAFSSAQLGYALAGSGFSPAWGLFFMSAFGVALIGLTNLLVSFSLALWLAFRARQLDGRLYFKLLQTVWALFKAEPRRFFFPPRQQHLADTACKPPVNRSKAAPS